MGNVISALAEGAKFIRYKDNILTRLMQDSLGGNAKTLMFVNASPSVYNDHETKNSLEYAKRVKEIKNNPTLNLETKEMTKARARISHQNEMIEEMKALLAQSDKSADLASLLTRMEHTAKGKKGAPAGEESGSEEEGQIQS